MCKLRSKKIKINKFIEFSETLDLQGFTPEFDRGEGLKTQSYYEFKLKGMIIHEGSADYGHYYSLIKADNAWYEFNDKVIKYFDVNELKERAFGTQDEKANNRGNAYMLFYQRSALYDGSLTNIPTLYHEIMDADINRVDENLMTVFREREFLGFHEKMMAHESFSNMVTNMYTYIVDKNLGFKLLVSYFLLYMLRDSKKQKIPEAYKVLANNLKNSVSSSVYLLTNLINRNVMLELLVMCPIKDMIYVVVGLVKNALNTVSARLGELTPEDLLKVKRFIHAIINHLIFVNNSLLTEEGILLIVETIASKKNLCETLRMTQYGHYLNYYFFGGSNLHLNLEEDCQSAFNRLSVHSLTQGSYPERSNKEIDPALYRSMLLSGAARYFMNLGGRSRLMSYLTRLDFWGDVMASLKGNLACDVVTDFLLSFCKRVPDLLERIMLNTRLNVQNFKALFHLYLKLAADNQRKVNEIIFERTNKLLHDKSFNNYMVFDYLVHFVIEACLKSEDFFNLIVERDTFLQTLISKNNYTQDEARCEAEHVS